ncbi:MAG: cyclopropane fatty acyl phospholipid synthase [Candidatus Nealsonbacteria bacterium]
MEENKVKKIAKEILNIADIQIDGNNPWDIKVYNENFYSRVLDKGSLGLGESYMDKWWDCQNVDQFIYKILRSKIDEKVEKDFGLLFKIFIAKLFNRQSKARAFQVGEKHYNLGNKLFKNMLDSKMIYSCGYWKDVDNLDQAQENKLDLICKKIGLEKGMKVLDIGCGWAGFAKYASEKYGVKVVGITISKEQTKLAKEKCKGLPIEIRLEDYRDIDEKFDRIVSIGMIEHVGYKNYRKYMEVVNRCLKDDGLFLLHTIGSSISVKSGDAWLDKYIFRNGMLPSIEQLGKVMGNLFVMEDWHNFSADYDKTLMAWHSNFNNNWDKIKSNYDERFFRMWNYYLLSCAGAFRARKMQLWQIVLSKSGVLGGYKSIR